MKLVIGIVAPALDIRAWYEPSIIEAAHALGWGCLVIPVAQKEKTLYKEEVRDAMAKLFAENEEVSIVGGIRRSSSCHAEEGIYASSIAAFFWHRDGRYTAIATPIVHTPNDSPQGDLYAEISGGQVTLPELLIPSLKLAVAQLLMQKPKSN